ncbi:MAG: NADH-quinone oxidoreductase subunit NuoG [Acidobacteria bacterium]|nr:NADH-quinone oxidoreductase subunit NuoG [Acidobacteriota bacterium]
MSDTEAPAVDGVVVEINGHEVVARKGELLIDAAERAGTYIPRFCYHERMKPVGMCRMCLVEVDSGRGPALQPSCMIECTPGMKVDTESEITKKAQDGVLEFLLLNHPLDCPVCDKGGECPLQDQTMAYGPGESRMVEEKRHKEKPIPISELVLLDRERCILCDRCTRFAKEVAGDPLIHFIHRGNNTEVNTFPDEPFASYFSGNTVQICPVGALTASTYRFKARPWDLETTESTCQGCSFGCRISIDSSRDQIQRFSGVDIDPVNWGWLCDKGRFSSEAVNAAGRLGEPLLRTASGLAPARWSEALAAAAAALSAADPAAIGVIGGARLTNEDAYAWSKLFKGVLGTDNVDAQLGDGLPAEALLGLPRTTIDDLCAPGGTVVLLGPDPKEELPVLFLRLRHAVENDGVTLLEISPRRSGISSLAAVSLQPRPGETGELLRALTAGTEADRDIAGIPVDRVNAMRALLAAAAGPVKVVLGRSSVGESEAVTLDATSVLLAARPDTVFLPAVRRANIHGALDMGLAPGLLPGRVGLDAARDWFGSRWPSVPAARGLDTTGILTAAAAGRLEVLVLLGADPLADFPDARLAERAIAGVRTIISVDTLLNTTSERAHIVLAAAGFAEKAGTTTNLEGRVSTLSQRVTPPGTARPDWVLATELASRLGADLGFASPAEILAEISAVVPSHLGLTADLLAQAPDGLVLPIGATSGLPAPVAFTPTPAVPAPPVDAYAFRLVATRKLYDQGTIVQAGPHLSGLAAGTSVRVNPYDFDRIGVAAGGTVSVRSPQATLVMPIHADAGVPRGTAAVVVNQAEHRVAELMNVGDVICELLIETTS